ncbi:MAG: hypothetical protein V3V05_11850 [Pontiella sp.]
MYHCKIVGSILLFLLLGTASLVAQTNDIEAAVLDDVYSVQDVLFRVQKQFVGLLPSDQIYSHDDKTVYAVEWLGMPEKLKRRMHATMVYGFPIYELRLITDPISRDTIFHNSRNIEVYRISQSADSYDPYAWWKNKIDGFSYSEIDEWNLWVFDYAHTGVSIQMVPVSLHTAFMEELAYQESQEQLMQSMSVAPMSMMMASMSTGPELQMGIDSLSNGTVEVRVEWESTIDSGTLEIFRASDLIAWDWQFAITNISTSGSTNYTWVDTDTNQTEQFYVTGTDYDEDNDLISSARERYLFLTREDLFDTDGDGLGGGWEMGYGFLPLSTVGTNGALGDVDNDGYSNLEEQLKDTNPKSPDSNSTTGTVATIRYYYDEDDRLTDFFVGSETAQKTILTASHNISEEVSAK